MYKQKVDTPKGISTFMYHKLHIIN